MLSARSSTSKVAAYARPHSRGRARTTECLGGCAMARRNQASKRKRCPAVRVAGVSLALAGSASAAINGLPTVDPSSDTTQGHEIVLGEEEVADVSLATFYVFDKEHDAALQGNILKATGGCGCGCGCGGCARLDQGTESTPNPQPRSNPSPRHRDRHPKGLDH